MALPTEPKPSEQILVADDDSASLELTEAILRGAGYRVATVPDGEAAWECLQASPMDLVVSDLFMPHWDGLALLRKVAEIPDHPSVIVVTGFASLESADEAGTDQAGVHLRV